MKDYEFSQTVMNYIQDTPGLRQAFNYVGQFLPEGAKYPALTIFTDKVTELNGFVGGQEQAKVDFTLEVLSSYSGLQELYHLADLLEKHFNGQTLLSGGGYGVHIRLQPAIFEGLQKTRSRNYRTARFKGTAYVRNERGQDE